MARRRSGMNNPGKILFEATYVEGQHFRTHCFEKGITLQEGMREALVDYLIKIGEIPNRQSLEIEEQMD